MMNIVQGGRAALASVRKLGCMEGAAAADHDT
eukprot:COSAG04_NODE_8070_length_1027_cov_1.042026_2_plen_31_part_01